MDSVEVWPAWIRRYACQQVAIYSYCCTPWCWSLWWTCCTKHSSKHFHCCTGGHKHWSNPCSRSCWSGGPSHHKMVCSLLFLPFKIKKDQHISTCRTMQKSILLASHVVLTEPYIMWTSFLTLVPNLSSGCYGVMANWWMGTEVCPTHTGIFLWMERKLPQLQDLLPTECTPWAMATKPQPS